MKMKYYFVAQFSILALSCFIINLGMKSVTRNSMPRQVLRRANLVSEDATLLLGNSLMAAGGRVDEFPRSMNATNIALGSTLPLEHYLLWRSVSEKKPKVVVYGFFDTMMTDEDGCSWSDLIGNRSIAYLSRDKSVTDIYKSRNLLYGVVSFIPALVDRGLIWQKIEVVRRNIGGYGLAKSEINQFGRAADFTLLEQERQEFRNKCLKEVVLSQPIGKMISEITLSGADTWVVLMPIPSAHRTKYYALEEWGRYKSSVFTNLGKRGVHCVDASSWVEDNGFNDALHLNTQGAIQFSRRLASLLEIGTSKSLRASNE